MVRSAACARFDVDAQRTLDEVECTINLLPAREFPGG